MRKDECNSYDRQQCGRKSSVPRMPVWTRGNRLVPGMNVGFSVTYDDEEVIGIGQEAGTSNGHLKDTAMRTNGSVKGRGYHSWW